MSIEALTVITPRPLPVMYTSLQAISASGGVYSPNLNKVELKNRNTSQGVITATISHISGNEYEWSAIGVNVASIGLNTIDVTAYDLGGSSVISTFQIYVDYTAPNFSSSTPSQGTTNRATNTPIQVQFNTMMSPSHVIAATSISPDVPGSSWQQGASPDIYTLSYNGYLQPYTSYTITITAEAKDAIAATPVDNIYVQAGNGLPNVVNITFTTGAGVGANDPTRRGFNPPEVILEFPGKVDNLLLGEGEDTAINPYQARDGWLTTQYTLRNNLFNGATKVMPELAGIGKEVRINPPGILNPFRYKQFIGDSGYYKTPELQATGGGGRINDNNKLEYLTTDYIVRNKEFNGIVYNISNAGKFTYIPILLSYEFENKASGGIVTKLQTRQVSMMWDNPVSRDLRYLNYRVEIARHPSFFKTIVFDSTTHLDLFSVASNGEEFGTITQYGALAGQGQTKFTCPVALEPGIWYVRLRVGGKKEEQFQLWQISICMPN